LSAAGNVGSSGATLLQYMGEPEVDQQTQVSSRPCHASDIKDK